MKRMLAGTIVLGWLGLSVSPAAAECTCGIAKKQDGWCTDCKVGYVDAVKIKSEKVFKALQGHEVQKEAVECPACKAALKEDGFCTHCRTGFVDGKAYHSWVAYHLAKGKVKDAATITCPACKKAAEHHGWCDACGAGYVGHLKFTDKKDYERAAEAQKVLELAAASKCEACAVAMVADGKCDQCNVRFEHGEKIKTARADQP